MAEADGAVPVILRHQKARDQIAADDEKDRDAVVAAWDRVEAVASNYSKVPV